MDELDLSLINALQIRPRAPWAELAGPLDVDPATLSRRWARLTETGSAWVTCYPGPSQLDYGSLALIEVTCEAGTARETADLLAGDPRALSVEMMSGRRDLVLTVGASDTAVLVEYVMDRVDRVPGVIGTRTSPVVRNFREGSRWRLDSLDPGQRTALDRLRGAASDGQLAGTNDRRLMLALGEDGRMTYSQLSERTGLPQSSVRRRVAQMLGSGRAVLRCDLAHRVAGWPVPAMLWLRVPPGELARTAAELHGLPEAKACFATVGETNLWLTLWLHRLSDLQRVEEEIVRRFPAVQIVDRAMTMRMVKRMGRLLDGTGRAVGTVPMDLWSPTWPQPAPAAAGAALAADDSRRAASSA
ncbi:Lrp/AsnC family transcriptional regulator [Actinomadura sp. 9N407]|uniref:Lrp/AsnC family transcriptional regulator n=1 Tax=Actinomadura sp. 9N407 TaxID=3375154 RepID=UPI0037935475